MKIIRMTSKALAAWKENVSHLVDYEGHIVRKLTNDEDRAVAAVIKKARQSRKPMEAEMTVANGTTMKKLQVKVDVRRTGRGDGDFSHSTTVDGGRYVSGRDVICAKLLAEHGECQLRQPNGTILKVLRDPGVKRPTFRDSLQTAPKPDNCPCVSWGKPHPGTHYSTCPWNRLAPPEERAPAGPTAEEMETLPEEAFAALARPTDGTMGTVTVARVEKDQVVMESEPLDPPETCRNECLKWAVPAGRTIQEGQHHPLCVFAEKWALRTMREEPFWLVNIRNGEKVRRATDEERAKAQIAATRTGSPVIDVDEAPYAVVSEKELEESA